MAVDWNSQNIQNFSIQSELYRSNAGSIYKAIHRASNTLVVLKERRHAELGRSKNLLNEVELLQRVSEHPNVVRFYGHFFRGNVLYMIMEYAERGDLYQLITTKKQKGDHMKETDLWYIFVQICRGVEHLHNHGVVHRDLKSLNIFMSADGEPKVGDLGVGRLVDNVSDMIFSFHGTPLYLSPELCDNKPYTAKTDVWSLGVILYEMAMYRPPFQGSGIVDLARNICMGKYDPIVGYTRTLTRVVRSMLKLNPSERPKVSEFLEWFDGYKGTLLKEINELSRPQVPERAAEVENDVRQQARDADKEGDASPQHAAQRGRSMSGRGEDRDRSSNKVVERHERQGGDDDARNAREYGGGRERLRVSVRAEPAGDSSVLSPPRAAGNTKHLAHRQRSNIISHGSGALNSVHSPPRVERIAVAGGGGAASKHEDPQKEVRSPAGKRHMMVAGEHAPRAVPVDQPRPAERQEVRRESRETPPMRPRTAGSRNPRSHDEEVREIERELIRCEVAVKEWHRENWGEQETDYVKALKRRAGELQERLGRGGQKQQVVERSARVLPSSRPQTAAPKAVVEPKPRKEAVVEGRSHGGDTRLDNISRSDKARAREELLRMRKEAKERRQASGEGVQRYDFFKQEEDLSARNPAVAGNPLFERLHESTASDTESGSEEEENRARLRRLPPAGDNMIHRVDGPRVCLIQRPPSVRDRMNRPYDVEYDSSRQRQSGRSGQSSQISSRPSSRLSSGTRRFNYQRGVWDHTTS